MRVEVLDLRYERQRPRRGRTAVVDTVVGVRCPGAASFTEWSPSISDVLIGGRDNDMLGNVVPMFELPEVESLVSRRRSGLRTVGAPS